MKTIQFKTQRTKREMKFRNTKVYVDDVERGTIGTPHIHTDQLSYILTDPDLSITIPLNTADMNEAKKLVKTIHTKVLR